MILRRREVLALAAAGLAAPAVAQAPAFTTRTIRSGSADIVVREAGRGPTVVMTPNSGRWAHDFDALGLALARGGYRAVLANPRGVDGSTGLVPGLAIDDYGADLIAVIEAYGPTATLVCNGGGARDARIAIRLAPQSVKQLISIGTGAGGGDRTAKALGDDAEVLRKRAVANGEQPADLEERKAALRALFFAPGNDPSSWLTGWDLAAGKAKAAAARGAAKSSWWPGPPIRSLVLEGADDAIAPPQADLQQVLGPQATILSLPHAGHAMLPEQPGAIAAVALAWLGGRATGLQGVIDRRAIRPR